jgi:hypothetical protein
MATRIEKAFGASSEALLKMQADYDRSLARDKEPSLVVRSYVPSFMSIRAMQIEASSERQEARAELPVLLRRLIVSTGIELAKADWRFKRSTLAKVIGAQNLSKLNVATALEKARAERAERCALSADWVLEELRNESAHQHKCRDGPASPHKAAWNFQPPRRRPVRDRRARS